MSEQNTFQIHVNIDIKPETLKAIVENAKKVYGPDEDGKYRIDTAQLASDMISKFLMEKNFDDFAADIRNYK